MGQYLFPYISKYFEVVAYVDNDPKTWGDLYRSCTVRSPDTLKELTSNGDTDIIVCSVFSSDIIAAQIKEMKLDARIIEPKFQECVEDDDASLIDDESLKETIEKAKLLYKYSQRSERITIVFLVQSLALMPSYESILEVMLEDERFEPIIVIIPVRKNTEWASCYRYERGLEKALKDRGYTYYLAYEKGRWLDFYSLNPDGIFYQTPHSTIYMPSICRAQHYSDHIKIMQTPYGTLIVDNISSLMYDYSGISAFLRSCWRLFVDKSNYKAFGSDPVIAEKMVLSGTPKVDFYKLGIRKNERYFKDENSTKILYTPTWQVKKGRSSFIEYHDYFIQLLQRKGLELVLRPHPLLIAELEASDIVSKSELERVLAAFKDSENCLFDVYGDYRCAILSTDFAIMDISSLTYEYLPTGKPLILTVHDEERYSIKPEISAFCYIARNREDLEHYVDMLLSGEDPLLDKRMEITRNLEDLFPNGGTNGGFIVEFIAQNIRDVR